MRTEPYGATHGFELQLPFSLRDGKNHSVRAFALDSRGGPSVELRGSPKSPPQPRPSAMEGWIDAVAAGDHVVGWALDRERPESAIEIHLYFDGAPGACPAGCVGVVAKADRPRPDIGAALGYPGDHGFSAAVPDAFRDGRPHTVRVYGISVSGGENGEIKGSPKAF